MKRFLLLTTLLGLTQIHAADPPSKRGGGLFGFGSRKSEQLSAGLFPENGYTATPSDRIVTSTPGPATSSSTNPATAPANGGSEIFRAGQPQQVNTVSYVIQNGRKIEKPIESTPTPAEAAPPGNPPVPTLALMTSATETEMELAKNDGRKKGGFLGFGRRHDAAEENEVVTPVPASGGFTPPPVAPPSTPLKTTQSVATPVADAPATPDFANVKEEKEEKSNWIPFLSRRKKNRASERETVATAPAVIAAAEPIPVATKVTPTTAAKPAASKPTATKTAAASSSATFEVPRNESRKDEKKDSKPGASGGGILSPIANIRVPRKEIDLSSAETIIQNGEIVAESETNFEMAPKSGPASQPQAPQIVNGVKTYTSWDDVNARSSSAADKIIGSMR